MKTGIVLAGGYSRRLGEVKALVCLNGKPMIVYVVEQLKPLVDELIVVVKKRSRSMEEVLENHGVYICEDSLQIQAPLVGLLTGFENSNSEYAVVSPCDSPLVDATIIRRLFEEASGFDAAIPMWNNGFIEPLHAVYRVKPCIEASRRVVEEGLLSVRAMIARLSRVRYVKVEDLGNPKHFLNLNTVEEFEASAVLQ
ncbi:molybdenum cofactor guanylyltransferase [Candidatus Bathyarchaeota archaeon]|nr:molybdenum cofactor guanylyltransferase [Candidatus Bathyarchaeota archaeon]MBS7613705.1 molybdenum cofactor guanylyltransferase [Candidatus Bathyarchaeota archaeon]MBS7618120.1 molybdenum cofactor guanylyltransferase [Candidatus Bathyarchaeota archaeon]